MKIQKNTHRQTKKAPKIVKPIFLLLKVFPIDILKYSSRFHLEQTPCKKIEWVGHSRQYLVRF